MTRQVSLLVNGVPVTLDYFAQAFIDHTVAGMVEALEGTGPIKNLVLSIDGDKVSIVLNAGPIPTNAFASKIIKNTITGTVSTLKGGSQIKTLQVSITR
ncbi:MAG: hypothetical protein Q7T05_05580 [Dehalococcoidia bacterium]|nr:hypothetical protein [Dehalococcoidia bacterium]